MLIFMIVSLAEITFTISGRSLYTESNISKQEIQHGISFRNPQTLEIVRQNGQNNLGAIEYFIDKTSNPDDAASYPRFGFEVNPSLPDVSNYNGNVGLHVKTRSPKDPIQRQKEIRRIKQRTKTMELQRNDEKQEYTKRKRKSPDDEYIMGSKDDSYLKHEKREYKRGGGMMSQMSLGFGALTDKTMMYGPRPLTSGNMAGGSFGMTGKGTKTSSITTGPFTNGRMSQSIFPPGSSNNVGSIPNGLSSGGAGMSSFPGSGSMTGSSSKSPFNMAMFSMQSQGNLSPSMNGVSMNSAGAHSSMGQNYNQNNGNAEADALEKKIVFGETVSIQYVNGKIIVPKTWSLKKVKALQAQIESGHTQSRTHSACPKISSDCPQSCIEFNNHACPVCTCADDICPDFPAGCRRGNVHINKDGCPVCVSKTGDDDWYSKIWNTES